MPVIRLVIFIRRFYIGFFIGIFYLTAENNFFWGGSSYFYGAGISPVNLHQKSTGESQA